MEQTRDWQVVLDRALNGNREALGDFWTGYLYPYVVYPYAFKQLRQHEDAEDAAHKVCVYLLEKNYYRKIRHRDVEGYGNCVRQMTKNVCINMFRARKHTQYVVTSQTIEQLRVADMAAEWLQRLEMLQPLRPVAEQTFTQLVQHHIGEVAATQYLTLIRRYSRYEYRRWKQPAEHFGGMTAEGNSALEDVVANEIREIVTQEIRPRVKEEEWDVFYRRHTEKNFSYTHHAAETGIPVSTLHSRYRKVLQTILSCKKLRIYLET